MNQKLLKVTMSTSRTLVSFAKYHTNNLKLLFNNSNNNSKMTTTLDYFNANNNNNNNKNISIPSITSKIATAVKEKSLTTITPSRQFSKINVDKIMNNFNRINQRNFYTAATVPTLSKFNAAVRDPHHTASLGPTTPLNEDRAYELVLALNDAERLAVKKALDKYDAMRIKQGFEGFQKAGGSANGPNVWTPDYMQCVSQVE
ncbi:transcriptional repressor NF-X1 homolog [Condylostylus longicornis]|uniref:transcriptional repressor NF-X1 homolog n=1 Tax=Condylostylus longicornis TaxID=2530218 RepID=UPI00244E4FFE|nr:transcriptional repressor NF-X1 homolog [Condylostylus longicornis]